MRETKVVEELERRCNILIEYAKPGEIATGMSGSQFKFIMALAPVGYPLDPETWMTEDYMRPCMTEEMFHSKDYDLVFDRLFRKAYKMVNRIP